MPAAWSGVRQEWRAARSVGALRTAGPEMRPAPHGARKGSRRHARRRLRSGTSVDRFDEPGLDGVHPLSTVQSAALQSLFEGASGRGRDQVPPLRRHHHLEAPEPAPERQERQDEERRVWLYVPLDFLTPKAASTASRSAQAWEAWSSASTSQNPDIELSVTSSGKPTRRQPSWPGWRTRPWIVRLSGTTCAPSTAARGVRRFISSLPAIPASHFPTRGGSVAAMIRGTSGRRSRGSSARRVQSGSSSRTLRVTSIWDLPRSPANFRAWAIRLKQDCSRRLRSERLTSDDGFSHWPTPTHSICGNRTEIEIGPRGLLFRNDPAIIGKQVGTGMAARTWTLLWLVGVALGAPPTGRRDYPFRSRSI